MNIRQSASILSILASVALVGAGCYSTSATTSGTSSSAEASEDKKVPGNPTLNVPPEVLGLDSPKTATEENVEITSATGPDGSMTTTVSGDLTTIRDDVSGLSFFYPTSLGKIQPKSENGIENCLIQRYFLIDEVIFFTSYDTTGQCESLGRGGYWGDQARAFSTEADVKQWCESKDECGEPYVNENGVTVYRAWTKSIDAWGEPLTNIDEYAAWNPNRNGHGILISNQGFVQAGLGRQQNALIAIVASLSFTE